MKDLFLIYINIIGKDYTGKYIYEFIFSDSKSTLKDIDGEEWDTYPASGRPEPPYEKFISNVGRLEAEIRFDVIQNSDTFAVWDAVDDVIALGWEYINAYDAYPEKRLNFKFGEPVEEVEAKLYEKDLILNYKNKTHEKTK
jgi:hypothetical protein